MLKRKEKHINRDKKYCPACGYQIDIEDAYCTYCGYSFHLKNKRFRNKKIKWKNITLILFVLMLIYVGIQYSNSQPIIPDFITSLFISKPK